MTTADRVDFRSYRTVTERHSHAFWQVVLPVRGKLDMDVGGRAGAVEPGRGALVAPFTDHAFQAVGDNCFLVADVAAADLPAPAIERLTRHTFFPIGLPVRALMEYRAETDLSGNGASHWCALLLGALVNADLPAGQEAAGVEKAVAFMRARLHEPLTVAEIAQASGLATHQLNAGFRRMHRQSPYAYLTGLRVEQALRLLAETSLPLGEIAYRTGHADQSAMTRRLRQRGHASPAAYRRAVRAK